jgi:hypothetical protein
LAQKGSLEFFLFGEFDWDGLGKVLESLVEFREVDFRMVFRDPHLIINFNFKILREFFFGCEFLSAFIEFELLYDRFRLSAVEQKKLLEAFVEIVLDIRSFEGILLVNKTIFLGLVCDLFFGVGIQD